MPSVFIRRLTSTLLLWAVIGAAIYWHSEPLFVAIAALFGLGTTWEFTRVLREDITDRAFLRLGMIISLLYWTGVVVHVLRHHTEPPLWLDLAALMLSLQGAFILSYRSGLEGSATLHRIFSTVFGTAYTVVAFGFIVRLMYFGADGTGSTGLHLMLFLIMVTKFTDMGAYAVGSMIGKHKMIPHISPAKSWEGFGGAFVGAAVAVGIMMHFFIDKLYPLTWASALGLVPLIGLAGIAGDLAESVIKRCVAVKDSGHSLPGIGGILDLTDSLLFTAPIFYFYLRLVTGEG